MIKKVKIKNFQPHENSTLEFHSGVNVITGDSDSGKTSILRAIRKVLTNRPLGDGFKSWFATEKAATIVEVETTEGSKVAFKRRGRKSTYRVNDGDELKAIRAGVPEEVLEVLNISDSGFQMQIDPYFLLQDSPPEAARRFNRLVDLDEIDRVIGKINKLHTETARGIKEREGRIKVLTKQKEQFKYLPSLEIRLARMDQLHNRAQQLYTQKTRLSEIVVKWRQIDDQINKADRALKVEALYRQAKALISNLRSLRDRHTGLFQLLEKLKNYDHVIGYYDKSLKASKLIGRLRKDAAKWERMFGRRTALITLLARFADLESKIQNIDLVLEDHVSKYMDLIKAMRVCPLCTAKLTPKQVEKIEKIVK